MASKYDVEAAELSAKEALNLKIPEAVPIYEQLLATYPKSPKLWKQYLEAHMAVNDEKAVRQIFRRCLLHCLQIPLWRCYIQFITKANENKGSEGQEETRKAFVFLLGHVGDDIASGSLWMDYITFLKSMVFPTAEQESRRLAAIRKVYQKAVITPNDRVEEIWKEYQSFEYSKDLVSEYQLKHERAKDVYNELKKYGDEIDWDMLAAPPSSSSKQQVQYLAWKRVIEFEKGNPLRLEGVSANKRIVFVYEQCLMYLYHYQDIWHDYASWHAKSGSVESAVKVINHGLEAIPDSELLHRALLVFQPAKTKSVVPPVLPSSVNQQVKVKVAPPPRPSPALLAFLANLPTVYGPSPDADFVLSICMQSNVPPAPSTRRHENSSNKTNNITRNNKQSMKRKKDSDRRDEEEDRAPAKRKTDVFMIRHMQKMIGARTSSQSGSSTSSSGRSASSTNMSGSTG